MIGKHKKSAGSSTEQLEALDESSEDGSAFPGPSPNSATNLLIADVVLRGVSMLFRRSAEERMLRTRIDPELARRVLNGRTMGRSLATYAVTRIATRSIPGLLVVGGGLVAKTIFDRRSARRKALEASKDGAQQPGKNPQG